MQGSPTFTASKWEGFFYPTILYEISFLFCFVFHYFPSLCLLFAVLFAIAVVDEASYLHALCSLCLFAPQLICINFLVNHSTLLAQATHWPCNAILAAADLSVFCIIAELYSKTAAMNRKWKQKLVKRLNSIFTVCKIWLCIKVRRSCKLNAGASSTIITDWFFSESRKTRPEYLLSHY